MWSHSIRVLRRQVLEFRRSNSPKCEKEKKLIHHIIFFLYLSTQNPHLMVINWAHVSLSDRRSRVIEIESDRRSRVIEIESE